MKTNLSPRDSHAVTARIDPFQRIEAPSGMRRTRSSPGDVSGAPSIRMDVKEDAVAYRVTAEMPGVRNGDIHVEIDGSNVSISARTRRHPEQEQGVVTLSAERRFGRSARTYTLRGEVDEAKAEARYQDGILELVLPKRSGAGSKRSP